MFQHFAPPAFALGGARPLAALRRAMKAAGLDAWIAPRGDAFGLESVPPSEERLAWLSGFTGSAGLAMVTADRAGLFVDGRYTLAAGLQADPDLWEIAEVPGANPGARPGAWLAAALPRGRAGYDPWLQTGAEIASLTEEIGTGPELVPWSNLIDQVWTERPPPPARPIRPHAAEFAGVTGAAKREDLAAGLRQAGLERFILTEPASVAWLLNIRGSDAPNLPVSRARAILSADGSARLFAPAGAGGPELTRHLGQGVAVEDIAGFEAALAACRGKSGFDPKSAPSALRGALGGEAVEGDDPCQRPRACKNASEIAGACAAHLRDGVAMADFLCWLEEAVAGGGLTEIDVVTRLEAFRARSPALRDLSFPTICGSGPNGAIVHYRVTEATNRPITPGDVLLIDSGAQYDDGTTDITRTLATGPVAPEAARAFALVLKGLIAVSTALWPPGLTGHELDPMARRALWQAGLDYDHGTGHGVGSCLDVHEGPGGISRRTKAALEPGMILSIEPGCYAAGQFGIRTENLGLILPAALPAGGNRAMLGFETLTLCPVDRRMLPERGLTGDEAAWLNTYHARVLEALAPLVLPATRAWLARACAPLEAGFISS